MCMPFDSDEWPDEPTEYDPESRWGDPENDLVSIPSVDIPSTKTIGEESGLAASGETISGKQARFFIVAVVFANIAVAGIGIGVLLIGFRGQWSWGSGSIALGLITSYRTYRLTTRYYDYIGDANNDDTNPEETTTTTQPISTADDHARKVDDQANHKDGSS